jgi:hypothetical protein
MCARLTISNNKFVGRNVKISAIFTESTQFAVSKPTANERYREKERIAAGENYVANTWATCWQQIMHMDQHKPVRKYSELQKGQREWKTEHSRGRRVKVLH